MDNYEMVELSVKLLAEQLQQAFEENSVLQFPNKYKRIENVVIAGMGGSIIPTDILLSVFTTNVPVVKVSDYHLPEWVGKNTLVFLSSYSGETEEILNIAREANDKNCLITGATLGGKLAEFFKAENSPSYVFNPINNPSGQPRMGMGYSLMSQIGILNKLELLTLDGNSNFESEIIDSINFLRGENFEQITEKTELFVNSLEGLPLLIFGAEHLSGNARVLSNQANETAKVLTSFFTIPEANHYLLEGLARPEMKVGAIFLQSEKYSKETAKRFELTRQIFEQKGHVAITYYTESVSKLKDALSALMFSGVLTLELARRYGVDPITIPTIDYFKSELNKI